MNDLIQQGKVLYWGVSERHATLLVWSPLAMGLLTGKYDDGIPEDSRFGREPWAKERYWSDETVQKVGDSFLVAEGCRVMRWFFNL